MSYPNFKEIVLEEYKNVYPYVAELGEQEQQIIENICKRVWNQAIELAANNVDADYTILSENAEYLFGQMVVGQDYEVFVIKGSVLKLKI